MKPIGALELDDLFVRSLPGDPSDENRPRQVRGACWSSVMPTPTREPRFVALVPEVCATIGLAPEETSELLAVLSGNRVLPGMTPYAACYGGHQFGNWAGQLGDGRAITLCETLPERYELQLKGAGKTPYSRGADGRAVLRSSLRELVASEAMFHLGVPTTRALSLVTTGDEVERDMLYDGHPRMEPGAIVCRVAKSFLRFGNYEIHTARGDVDTLAKLVDYTLAAFFPEMGPRSDESIGRFFSEVCRRTAALMAEWMRVGFVHGVMNTDNMSILGVTIDYGPFGWLDAYDPSFTPNTTDAGGRRYRYAYQPRIAGWNLAQLGNALTALVSDIAPLQAALERYAEDFETMHRRTLLAKLGLTSRGDDDAIVEGVFDVLDRAETDFTLFFRALPDLEQAADRAARFAALTPALYAPDAIAESDRDAIDAWLVRYRERARLETESADARRAKMNRVNPLYIPRNYQLQLAIDAATQGDREHLATLLEVLRHPYDAQPGRDAFAAKRPEWARHRVGCSMLSCSS